MGLDTDQLVEAACERVGSDDLGDDTWREGLEVLVRSLGTEAALNDMGASAMADQIVGYLANRLEVEQCYTRHPEIEDQEIVAPLFGVGLSSDGVHCLELPPGSRSPLGGPCAYGRRRRPARPPETATEHTDPRIAVAQAGIDFTNEMFPGFEGMLPTSATGPQECLLIMALDFRSLIFEGMALVPSYSSWLLEWRHGTGIPLPPEGLEAAAVALSTGVGGGSRHRRHMLSMDALDVVYPRRSLRHDAPRRRQGAAIGVRVVRQFVSCPR